MIDEKANMKMATATNVGPSELNAIEAVIGVYTTEQNDEGSTTANEQGVGEDTECLYQSLLDGMADICDAGRTGCRAFTGLVGEQSALDTRHHHGTEGTTGELPETESILNNEGKHAGHKLNVDDKDDQRQKNI